jgi:hypothetical protein
LEGGNRINKYEILFYNRFACENQLFHVIASNEEYAEQLFWLRHNKESYFDCIEYITEYFEPHFYTEEEIKIQNK